MTGTSTALLHETLRRLGGGECAGVDVSASVIEHAAALHPDVRFSQCDAWDVRGLQHSMADGAVPSLVMLDVGGISSFNGELDALALVRLVCSAFGDGLQAVVVKSTCLHRTARNLLPADASHSARRRRKEARKSLGEAQSESWSPASSHEAQNHQNRISDGRDRMGEAPSTAPSNGAAHIGMDGGAAAASPPAALVASAPAASACTADAATSDAAKARAIAQQLPFSEAVSRRREVFSSSTSPF